MEHLNERLIQKMQKRFMNTKEHNIEEFKFLQTTKFKDINFWDYHSISDRFKINSQHTIVKLKDVLTLRKNFITIEENKNYKRCRVQLYGRGVILRDIIKGKEILTKKQQTCKKDDFLVAEIDAKFGGYGIVPSSLNGAIVSGHYFLFDIAKEKLLPGYLSIVLKTTNFSKQVKSTGSTNYSAIRPYHVLEYKIPLPSINEQERLVSKFGRKIKLADKQLEQSETKEKKINKYLLDELGVKIKKSEKKTGIAFTRFSALSRWATDYLFNLNSVKGINSSKYPSQKIRSILVSYQYGLSEKASENPIGIPMLRMNNINDGELIVDDLKYISIDKHEKEKYLLEIEDLLFNRTNSKELVGKTAVFNLKDEYTFASYLIRLKFDLRKVNVNFVNYLFNSPIGRVQIDLISRQGLGQANVNAQELQDFIFPIPDLKIQNKIAKKIKNMKLEVNQLKVKGETNKNEAISEFEKLVFKN
jgi:type I restriction enzyme, S subunit